MKKIILGLLVAIVVAGCQSFPDTPLLNRVDTQSAAILDSNDSVYEWDHSISHALNFATIGDQTHGLQDRLHAEDAQRDVSRAEHVGTFLTNFIAGGTLGGAAARHTVTSARDASYKFTPYALLFVNKELVKQSNSTYGDGGFQAIFPIISEEIKHILEAQYPGSTVNGYQYNFELLKYQHEYGRLRSGTGAHIVIDVAGEACDVAIEQRTHFGGSEPLGIVDWRNFTVEGTLTPENCRMYISISNQGLVEEPLFESAHYAFKLSFEHSADWIRTLSEHANVLAWVLSTEWQEYYRQITMPMPLVVYSDKAHLFTRDNTIAPLSEFLGD